MARRACTVLHVPMPKNPYAMVYNARERKGVKQKSFFSRYCWLMYCRHSRNPLYANDKMHALNRQRNGKVTMKNINRP